jgi:Holliday junction resolvase
MRAAKVDKNQREIVEALRAAGCSVLILSRVGQGCPDLAVGKWGRTYLLEVKTARGTLTEPEQEFMETWRGHVQVVRTVDEALEAVR